MSHRLIRIRLAGIALAMPLYAAAAHAECPCQQGQGASVDTYAPSAGYSAGQYYSSGASDAGSVQYGVGGTPYAAPSGPVTGMAASTPGTPFTPPPGTLGQTYQLRSDPVPGDRHPRAGMVVVHAPGATNVLVQDTNNFRTQDTLKGFEDAGHRGTWHFESIMMLPGQPNIHRIVAIYPAEDGSRVEVRYVRFIMGRVVYLDI